MNGPVPMPAAEVDIKDDLVRSLLREQHPDLADLPLRLFANGWDNAMYRLGDELSVRLPRRRAGADLITHELRWLPQLAASVPIPAPVPVRAGAPGCGYPWSWSVCRWIDGEVAAHADLDGRQAAVDLGGFLASLHTPAPEDAPPNAYRGLPLARRDHDTRGRLEQLRGIVRSAELAELWDRALAIPVASGPPVWLHGDLHPANIVVRGGSISGVIDWGDLTAGDRATDLSVAWMLFGPEERAVFRAAAGSPDDDTWERARGWAITLGLAYVASSADNPTIASIGRRTLDAVLAEPR